MASPQDAYKQKMMLWGALAIVAGVLLIGGYKYFSASTPAGDPKQITESDWKRGAIAPQVTMIEYGDFECPACKAYEPVVKRLLDTFPTQLALVFRHYPLNQIHQNAQAAAQAAQAAGLQGKFFEMHDLLYDNQDAWAPLPNPQDKFQSYAEQLHLNIDQWKSDKNSSKVNNAIKNDQRSGDALTVQGTPTFFVNGTMVQQNPQSFDEFKAIIQNAINNAPAPQPSGDETPFHAHANFLVMINGKAIDFSKPQYQSPEGKELNEYVHLHNNRGEVVHVHKENTTWQTFFQSLGMDLTATCFSAPSGSASGGKVSYCNSGAKKLSLILNGTPLTQWDTMPINDLDRLLINYGPQTAEQLLAEFKTVSDDACIFSEKCPERGKPPADEPCVGGLGTKCK